VPANLAATAISSFRVNLTWSASSDDTAVAGYRIFRGGVSIATSTLTNYSDTGLTALTQYTYTVSAFDAASNESAQTAGRNVTTLAEDTAAPSVPVITRAGAVSSNAIDIFWNASTDNIAVAGYRVFRDGVEICTTTDIGFSDTGLTPGREYTYTVSAYDTSNNQSAVSVEAKATTTPIYIPPKTPANPRNLRPRI
jgi:chitinase